MSTDPNQQSSSATALTVSARISALLLAFSGLITQYPKVAFVVGIIIGAAGRYGWNYISAFLGF